jgi:tetratricopeptide (TPR) repeat protein
MHYEEGKFEQALLDAQKAGDLTNQMPAYSMAIWVQGLCLEQMGRTDEAEKLYRKAIAWQPHDLWNEPALGHLLARTKRIAEAEALLSELRALIPRGRLTYAAQALIHAGLGRSEEALQALERGVAERDDAVPFILLDPRLRAIAADPRFQAIVQRHMRS